MSERDIYCHLNFGNCCVTVGLLLITKYYVMLDSCCYVSNSDSCCVMLVGNNDSCCYVSNSDSCVVMLVTLTVVLLC